MSFTDAVQSIPDIAGYLKVGLQALGSNSSKVEVRETRELTGSVDIDTCLERHYPNAPRWDYVFGYKDRVYYIEIHPADWVSTGRTASSMKRGKYLQILAQNGIRGPDSVLNVDAIL